MSEKENKTKPTLSKKGKHKKGTMMIKQGGRNCQTIGQQFLKSYHSISMSSSLCLCLFSISGFSSRNDLLFTHFWSRATLPTTSCVCRSVGLLVCERPLLPLPNHYCPYPNHYCPCPTHHCPCLTHYCPTAATGPCSNTCIQTVVEFLIMLLKDKKVNI